MKQAGTNSHIYYRLIALWVLCEAMLGGIIHGLRIPVSGLFVGSCAVICICLLAYYVPSRGAILKATIIVAIFKMMLSPQTPPPAYIAVFFQGLIGELLFLNRRLYKISCVLLGIIALLESGLQRIIVLTIVYGNEFWNAINEFINGITQQKQLTNYSLLLAAGYVLLHVIAGLLVGWWVAGLPQQIRRTSALHPEYSIDTTADKEMIVPSTRRRTILKKGLFIIWIVLILLYVQSYYRIGTPLLPSLVSLKIFIRSFIIVLAWYFLVGPLLRILLNNWLQKRKTRSQPDIQKVLEILPATQQLIIKSWQLSAGRKGWRRMILCCKIILINAASHPAPTSSPHSPSQGGEGEEGTIYILTGPIQSGKTTKLVEWSEGRDDVYGILTPVVYGKRVFMDAHTREQFSMEADRDEHSTISIGRFVFSGSAFGKAIGIIRDSMNKAGWLIVDEIGPLELRGEGFAHVLKEVMELRHKKILLVVREGFEEEVKKFFEIRHANILNNISGLND